jgi:c(7)-type cytochrome triheme protein
MAMTRTIGRGRWAGLLLGAALCGGAAAGELKKLPGEYAFPQGDGSPATVTFRHETHVDAAKPSCVACHPVAFSMLQKGKVPGAQAVKHEDMEKGKACGACHGKQAFGLDSCDTCHRG